MCVIMLAVATLVFFLSTVAYHTYEELHGTKYKLFWSGQKHMEVLKFTADTTKEPWSTSTTQELSTTCSQHESTPYTTEKSLATASQQESLPYTTEEPSTTSSQKESSPYITEEHSTTAYTTEESLATFPRQESTPYTNEEPSTTPYIAVKSSITSSQQESTPYTTEEPSTTSSQQESTPYTTEEPSTTSSQQESTPYTTEEPSNTSVHSKVVDRCPEGLEFQWLETNYTCYVVTRFQTFPPKCPYPNFLPGELFGKDEINYSQIWSMGKRDISKGFGPFEWTQNVPFYGNPFPSYDYVDDILNKSCMIWNGTNRTPVNCNERYPAVCVYPYQKMGYKCLRFSHYDYMECNASTFNIEKHNCYCSSNSLKYETIPETRYSYCETLAEPLEAYQNTLLTKHLSLAPSKCWFGLYKHENGELWWEKSRKKVSYRSYEIEDESNPNQFGAISYTSRKWLFSDDASINCGICELEQFYNTTVILTLKYPHQDQFYLEIKNADAISNMYDWHYALYCFVGPTTNQLKEKLGNFNDNDFIIIKGRTLVKLPFPQWKYPVYYWCEGFQTPNFTQIYSNSIWVYDNKSWRDYSITVMVYVSQTSDPYLDGILVNVTNHIIETIQMDEFSETLRIMKILNLDQINGLLQMVLHFTMGTDEDEQNEYEELGKLFEEKFKQDILIQNITLFGRSEFCMSTTSISSSVILHWPKTPIGKTVQSTNICTQQNGVTVKRKCKGDFLHGGTWSEDIGVCVNAEDIPERTQKLNDLLNNENITADELSGNLTVITENNKDVTVTEIYLMAEILEKLESFGDDINKSDIAAVISNVMDFEAETLHMSQEELNSTDKMLNSLDNVLANVNGYEDDAYSVILSQNLLIQMSDVTATNITGVALKRHSESENLNDFTMEPIYRNFSIDDVILDNIELMACLPEDLITELEMCQNLTNSIKLIFSVFYNPVLFNENTTDTRQVDSRVIGILLPELNCTMSTSMPIIFKPLHTDDLNQSCSYWDYGLDKSTQNNKKGCWGEDRSMKNLPDKTLVACAFNHLTHFSVIMMGDLSKSNRNTKALEIITAVGAIASLSSIMAIFILTIFNRTLRQSTSSQIFLNFSLAVALQLITLYVADYIKSNGTWCIISGIALHYTIMSEFCWMLVIAILQYKRFVIVFYITTTRLVTKSCLFCWCAPFLPIIIIGAISSNSYKKNPQGICFPSGYYFYMGVVLPIFVIILANFIVFVRIVFAICRKRVKAYGGTKDDTKVQIILAVFLFFLLGINWIFGIAVSFGAGVWCSYLFCLTSTFQGLIMFLFFLAMYKNCSKFKVNLKRFTCCGCGGEKVLRNYRSTIDDTDFSVSRNVDLISHQ